MEIAWSISDIMPYVEKNSVRCDIRFPTDVYSSIEKLAIDHFQAPIHHRSRKPQVSATIVQLVQWGLEYFKQGLHVSDTLSDTASNNRAEQVIDTLTVLFSDYLSDNLPDKISDKMTNPIELISSSLSDNLPDKKSDKMVENISDTIPDKASDKAVASTEKLSPPKAPELSEPRSDRLSDKSAQPEALSTTTEPSPTPQPEKRYTDDDVAADIGCSGSTAYRWRTG
ncbi:MAG: hypothetical protein QNJ54_32545, partial [Prochloraceae cyanobacterium]|nr:hypothetical protein [Prochloraceae cyanobacterium]